MAPPARTITVALDMSKAFDTINIHTLIRKVIQTYIPGTIIKFIVNYIKIRKAYTTYRNHTSRQRQFKTGVPQGGVLSPTLFNIHTSDLPPPSSWVHVLAYADDITITSTHTSTSAAKTYMQPYLHKVFAWTKQNNIILNPDKTTSTLFTPHPAEYTSNLDLEYTTLHYTWQHTQVLGLILDPKLTYSTHIYNFSVHIHKPLQIIKHSLQHDGVNRRRHSWLPTRQLWDQLWSMPLPYGRLLHPRPTLANCKSCKMQHWELPQDVHKTQAYNICMTKHSHFLYTSTYSSTAHDTNRKHNIHHIHYTNTQQTPMLKTLF